MERCARCGEEGEDRRTLWMACFYAMNELNVPFEQVAIRGKWQANVGTHDTLVGPLITWEDAPNVKEDRYDFFTLRVCKRCRADWMSAIDAWFGSAQSGRRKTGTGVFVREHGVNKEWFGSAQSGRRKTGTGVFVREHGVNKELTEAEIAERWPEQEL